MKKYIKHILLFVLFIILCILIYFFYINKNKETKEPVYEQTPKKNEVLKDEIDKTIELIYLENKEYIDLLNNDNIAITSFLIKKTKEKLPGGASASEIRDNVILFLNTLNQ
ncbi:MAG: hypothetical protein PHX40_01830 [Bacilli bacterium]|nr:hypothetical protein [Bacilli bacterium]